jgi:glucan biosynthesis protein C
MTTMPDGAAQPSIGAHGRIEGLTAWRALLMLAGLPLHATFGDEHYPAFALIGLVSGSFRMGTFFMISGLLSGFALLRCSHASVWLRRRLVQLGAPLLFGLAVISPLIGLTAGTANPLWPIVPYHLWFLIGLIGYSLLGFALHRVDGSWSIFDRVERRSRAARRLQVTILLTIGLVSFVLMSAGGAIHAHAPEAARPTTAQMPLIVGYAPLFLLGFAAARSSTLRCMFIASRRVPATILGSAIAAYVVLHLPWAATLSPERSTWWSQLLEVAASAWCPAAATALILRSATAMRRVPDVFHRIADASFTMYLLHFPIIVATKVMLRPLHLDVWSDFAIAILAGGGLSYVIHRRTMALSPILALLVGGRLPSSGAAPSRRTDVVQPPMAERPVDMEECGELSSPSTPRVAASPF